MPKLIIKDRQKVIQEFELTTEKVVIGRGDESTIKLEDVLISRAHCQIREESGKYILSDLGSSNGTFVGAKSVLANYPLKDGDIIKIGPFTLAFVLSPGEKPTQIMQAEEPKSVEKTTEIFTFSSVPRILVRSGAEVGKTFDLSKNPLIGRDPECDVQLSEITVSRRHARIQFIDNRLSVIDVGSRGGTRVNGKLIDKPTPVKDGDKIQLGEVTLEIDWKGAPRGDVERATMPYYRPEATPTKKSDWWKWVVGVAAAVIIIIGALLGSHVMPWRPTPNKDLAEARQALNNGKYATAVLVVNRILNKEPRNVQAIEIKTEAYKNIALRYETSGDSSKEAGKYDKAKEFYTLAVSDCETLLVMNQANTWAFEKKRDLKQKYDNAVPPVRTDRTYPNAVALYYKGNIPEAANLFRTITGRNYNSAQQYLRWISIWEEARYLKRTEAYPEARAKYNTLLFEDPNNQIARDELSEIPTWQHDVAVKLDTEAEPYYRRWKNYGYQEDGTEAKNRYQKIVEMGTPIPSDQDLYDRAVTRLEELKK
jgi:pSer/pThr/pTyr-binding forkhead associated (FHA) protein/tetratricopeptide (TPR) repeat protein